MEPDELLWEEQSEAAKVGKDAGLTSDPGCVKHYKKNKRVRAGKIGNIFLQLQMPQNSNVKIVQIWP